MIAAKIINLRRDVNVKKKLVASLAAAMVLGVAGTSFAATNPFVDLPAKHWAYGSVAKLAQAGIVDGYNDGTFRGDKKMSRYEMAQIVAKAMTRSDKADAGQKAMIDKLVVEFASELEGLNVRVSKLEKSTDKVKLTGIARVRYEGKDTTTGGLETNANTFKLRTRIMVSGEINSDWKYNGRLENVQDLRRNTSTAKNNADNETKFNIANVQGPILGMDSTIGRQAFMPNYGLLLDTVMDGTRFAFGNKVKTNVYYGRIVAGDGIFSAGKVESWDVKKDKYIPAEDAVKVEIIGADFQYATSKATNLVAGVYQLKDTTTSIDEKMNAYEIGFDSKLSDNLVLKSGYAIVKADGSDNNDNKAYFAGLNYKVANVKKVGSYSLFANYRNIEANAQLAPTFDSPVVKDEHGGKGFEVGFQYVPIVNAMAKVKYVDLKSSPTSKVEKTKLLQAQVELFF
jgi:hypothetical protein